MTPIPLSRDEEAFSRGFPGRIRRFKDGAREVIVRWTLEPTRRLHPSSDCLAASGYSIKPLPARRDEQGAVWSRFVAVKGGTRLKVRERVHDLRGGSWSDVSLSRILDGTVPSSILEWDGPLGTGPRFWAGPKVPG